MTRTLARRIFTHHVGKRQAAVRAPSPRDVPTLDADARYSCGCHALVCRLPLAPAPGLAERCQMFKPISKG